jgi:hypothetical protein
MPDYIDCNKGCGQKITFDDNVRSPKSGKLIPIGENGQPHDCPNRQTNTNVQRDSNAATASNLTISSDQVKYDSLGPTLTQILEVCQETNDKVRKLFDRFGQSSSES